MLNEFMKKVADAIESRATVDKFFYDFLMDNSFTAFYCFDYPHAEVRVMRAGVFLLHDMYTLESYEQR